MRRVKGRRERLAVVAERLARKPFHGNVIGLRSNLSAIVELFPRGRHEEFEGKWCAGFVYHCCDQAGFGIPPRYPEPVSCSFAGVKAWLQWARLPSHRFYFSARNARFESQRGDLVIYDRVFMPGPHDHIGVVLGVRDSGLVVAEGNVNNLSAVVQRNRDHHIRGYIRIPDDYRYP